MDDLEFEPFEPEDYLRVEPKPEQPTLVGAPVLALTRALPADFDLPTLLQFLPDPRLKQRADEHAAAALAITVAGESALHQADTALAVCRADLGEINRCYEYPVGLAHDLHVRLTGLRREFGAAATAAVETVGRRIVNEQRRLAEVAAVERRQLQEEADRQAREAAQRAADEAAAARAPKPIVQALREEAKSTTAPPVGVGRPGPALRRASVTERWVARLTGTLAETEPNPATEDLTDAQRLAFLLVVKAVLDGKAPLAIFQVDWGYVNRRAAAEKAAFAIPGFEAVDVGALRAKPWRQQ